MRAIILLVVPWLTTALPAWGAGPDVPSEVRHYLVEMSCGPDDRDAITKSLLMALALREEKSTVTLFIDVAAVHVANPANDLQSPELQRETGKLFDKLRAAGVLVLVCPHCAELHGLAARSLRQGLRFTSKEELETERKRADKVYEYRPPKAGPADAGKTIAENRNT